MKPLYLILLFYALLITGLGDALELAFTAVLPGVGIVIGMPLAVVINITMGSGLVLLLVQNGMFHPKFGPAGVVAGALPGIDTLPIWLALVIMGILQKMAEEDSGLAGNIAKVATSINSLSLTNPSEALKTVNSVRQLRQTEPQTADNRLVTRSPIELKSPTMRADVLPRHPVAANDNNRPYVQKAA